MGGSADRKEKYGGLLKGKEKYGVLVVFYFLTKVVITWVCSLCDNSVSHTLKDLFTLIYI